MTQGDDMTRGVGASFQFDTEAEARAFAAGVEWVNDRSISTPRIEQDAGGWTVHVHTIAEGDGVVRFREERTNAPAPRCACGGLLWTVTEGTREGATVQECERCGSRSGAS